MPQHLRDRLAVNPEQPRRRVLAHPIDMARPAYQAVQIHGIHLPAFSSFASGAKVRNFTPRRSGHPTDSAVHFVSGIHIPRTDVAPNAQVLLDWSRERLAGFKRPLQ